MDIIHVLKLLSYLISAHGWLIERYVIKNKRTPRKWGHQRMEAVCIDYSWLITFQGLFARISRILIISVYDWLDQMVKSQSEIVLIYWTRLRMQFRMVGEYAPPPPKKRCVFTYDWFFIGIFSFRIKSTYKLCVVSRLMDGWVAVVVLERGSLPTVFFFLYLTLYSDRASESRQEGQMTFKFNSFLLNPML